MALFLFILCAGMLGRITQHRLKLDESVGVYAVSVAVWVAILGFISYCSGLYSIAATTLLLFAMTLPLLVICNKNKLLSSRTQTAPLTIHKTFYTLLALFPLLLAFAFLLVPTIQTPENSDLLTLLKNYGYSYSLYFDASVPGSGAPQLGYAIFTLNPRHYPPGLTPFYFAAFSLVLLYGVARHYLEPRPALLATAAFACSPLFLYFASQPGFDALFCCFLLATINALLYFQKQRHTTWLVFAAILCGAACGVYYLGYLLLFLFSIALLLGTKNIKATLSFLVISLLLAVPWLLRNYYFIGNPVYPNFQAWFPTTTLHGPYIAYFQLNPTLTGSPLEIAQRILRFPWEITMQPQNFKAWPINPGLFLIAFALPGIALGNTRIRLLALFTLLGGGLCFAFTNSVYTLAPFIALMLIVAIAALERFPKPFRPMLHTIALLMIMTGPILQLGLLNTERQVLLGHIPRTEYFANHIEHFPAFGMMNENYNEGGTVLLLEPRTWHLEIPALYNPWLLKHLATLNTAEQKAWLQKNNIRYLLFPENKLLYTTEMDAKTVEMLKSWASNRNLFHLTETYKYPGQKTPGIDRVKLYTFTGK